MTAVLRVRSDRSSVVQDESRGKSTRTIVEGILGSDARSKWASSDVARETKILLDALRPASNTWAQLGRYVIMGTLGKGGMGQVMRGFDPRLDRRVAIKVLNRGLSSEHGDRLLREAQALAKLSHPNVVQVYEIDQIEGQAFVVMELVDGHTLRRWIEERPGWRECIEVFRQLGRGLGAAHACGLVHRDFKPDNAIVDDSGRARVLDFGLACLERQLRSKDDDERSLAAVPGQGLKIALTQPGTVLGTPAYMPLEQIEGGKADARSDQFSFCASLYEALYGELPYEGGSLRALANSMREGKMKPAPVGAKVPGRVRRILVRGLSADARCRWDSMEDLLAELGRAVTPRARKTMSMAVGAGLLAAGYGLDRIMEKAKNMVRWMERWLDVFSSASELDPAPEIWKELMTGAVMGVNSFVHLEAFVPHLGG